MNNRCEVKIPMANEQKAGKEERAVAGEDAAAKANDATAAETGSEEEVIAQELTQLLEDSRAKAEAHWDQLLRLRAEMDNINKRHARDLENAHKYALDNFVRELLQVWDSLELGLSHAQDAAADVGKLREGMELTVKVFADVLEKFGVEQINPEGEVFNPEYHQADMEPNHVAVVVQKGCLLNGRLVRPAMVIVSQATT
jgi:molecular chaperone GrpE